MDTTIAIDERLEYFQELEQATRMLNHPGESLVLQGDFLYMVERVDVCIDYLKAHVREVYLVPCGCAKSPFPQRHFKEAEIYLLRFQQCMTRAMTLIKMYFVGSLRALTADVSKRLSEKANIFLFCSNYGQPELLPNRMFPPPPKHICCTQGFKLYQGPARRCWRS